MLLTIWWSRRRWLSASRTREIEREGEKRLLGCACVCLALCVVIYFLWVLLYTPAYIWVSGKMAICFAWGDRRGVCVGGRIGLWLFYFLYARAHTHSFLFLQDSGELIGSAAIAKSRKSAAHAYTWTNMHILFTCITLFYILHLKLLFREGKRKHSAF